MNFDEIYDVVIVGAGVTGSIVASKMAENGKRVLILEAGSGKGLKQGGFNSFLDRFFTADIKSPIAPFPHSDNAPVDFGIGNYYVQEGPQNFGSNNTRVAGGTTLHWMGTSLRYLPNDFNLKSTYDRGIDWPIDYEDLEPYYQQAEWELGVAANVEDQEQLDPDRKLFGEGYEFPMEQLPPSYLEKTLGDLLDANPVSFKVAGEKIKLGVARTPTSRNSIPRKSTPEKDLIDPRNGGKLDDYYRPIGDPDAPYSRGQRCQGNANCIPICPVQAKYSALKTLRGAMEHSPDRIDVVTQAVASQVEIEPDSGRVSGIRFKRYLDPNSANFTEHVARGKVYVIAAHAIETAKLLLASRAANSSDMVGRNLMDHPFVLTWGLMPDPTGSYRGPGSTSGIPQFRDGKFREDFAAFRIEIGNWGVDFPNGTPEMTVRSLVDRKAFSEIFGGAPHPEQIRQNGFDDDLFGTELLEEIKRVCSRQFRIGFELEQLPETQNRVTIDERHKDAIGNHRPVIHYELDKYCRAGIVQTKRVWDEFCKQNESAGVVDETDDYKIPNPIRAGDFEDDEGNRYEYNGAGHLCGTHRMGSSSRDSVVDPKQRTWDHENLFLVGCGNFCTVGTANPTLTAAALAFQAAENILKELG